MTRELRDYQREAVEAIEDAWAGGCQRPAVVMATGLGKTDVIAHLAARRVRAGGRVLALAHRLELLHQITARCRMWLPDESHSIAGIVAGERDERNRPIVAAMAQTLRHPRRRARFVDFGPGDLVIVDECHHAAAKSYVDVMTHFGALDETSGVSAFGVTATMYRAPGAKGAGLGDVWEKVVYERGLGWAIAKEWLVPLRGLAVVADHLDLSKVKTRQGDYAEGELGELVAQDAEQIVDAWCRHASDRITVGFFPTKVAVEAARAAFERRGVACEVVLGETSAAERGDVASGTGIYGRLARGETRVMLGLMVPTEGWDCPPVSCVLMARPTKIDGLYQQCVGRGARLSPETGKRDCLVLDVVGVTRAASLRTLTDLLPGSEYADERPPLCARCNRPKRRVDKFGQVCICPPAERDEDGGRTRLIGPQRYEEIDLFGEELGADGEGDVLWLKTRGGIAFVPAKDRIVAVLPEPGGTWKAGVVERDRFGKGERLTGATSLAHAVLAAEEWVREYCEATYWARFAPWRTKPTPPSDGQLRAARAMNIEAPETYTRAALSDLLSIRAASRRLDPRGGSVKATNYAGRPAQTVTG